MKMIFFLAETADLRRTKKKIFLFAVMRDVDTRS